VSARLKLRVSPGAAAASVVGRHGAAWKVRVADVSIVSWHGSGDKTVALERIDPRQIERRLAAASGAGKDHE
jgi:uncharacterized protein YggU (UPF0235/DUF167 family)